MASGEEARRASVSSSSVGLEALFPADGSEQACGDGNPELERLRERLQGWLSQYEPAVVWAQRLLVWERPLYSTVVALVLNTVFWLLSSTSLRPLFLLSVSLLGLMLLERWKDKLPKMILQHPEASIIERETMRVQPRLLSMAELSHHLAESYLTCCLYLQEMLQFKRQNHGKFCGMMCASCSVLAVVGHYVPGVMISYIIVLSVLLWPLVVYHELIQKMYTGLEPILMKLDYSMKGDTQHRKHEKRKVKKESEEGDEPRAETESESEEELSCFAPTVDVKTTALAMAITDSELSDEEASILESGGFSVSRATTPQLTDVSEDLDQQSLNSEPEETFSRDLPEFPSVEDFPSMEPGLFCFPLGISGPSQAEGSSGELLEAESQSPASLFIQHLASPLHFVNTHFNGHGRLPAAGHAVQGGRREDVKEEGGAMAGAHSRSLEALSEEIVTTAISAVVQNTLSALLRSTEASEAPSMAEFMPTETPPCPLESSLDPHVSAALPHSLSLEEDEDLPTETSAEEQPDVTLMPAEEEDFELLDQSELETMDEGLDLGPDRQGESLGSSTDTPISDQPHQES
ncbi:reticulophagy regulator 2 isoform X2 [Denticeps clupeoides]|uniref:reticulophagy regulator 2 isoform X2 n=1 Tax=Denticeps clupeoides TaxID=299321 RepID=UPI0010A3245A|nr:reticulophagy regulator 2 isoform X2 [Denticeps clupeoides]